MREAHMTGLSKRTTKSAPRLITAASVDAPALHMTDEECRKRFAEFGNNWFELKKKYKSDPETMWQLWAFRKKVVDGTMNELRSIYGFDWDSVGSTNLESDYDITVKTHGKNPATGEVVCDFEIVEMFNDAIMADFGVQPGTLFDTNLYASAPPQQLSPDLTSPVAKAMLKMAEAGQDVGALMKQRRFMSWEAYDNYTQTVTDKIRAMGKSVLAEAALKQFEEADALVQISLFTVLETARELLDGDLKTLANAPEFKARREAAASIAGWVKERMDRIGEGNLLEGQKRMLEAAAEFEHRYPDMHMRTSNYLYVQRLKEARQIEVHAAQLDPAKDTEKLNGLLARRKTLATDAVFFANEAYLSEGPFLHVVKAIQTVLTAAKQLGGAERITYIKEHTAKELAKLSASQCLQSFNEQLGDLLKDLEHYRGEPSQGVGFYRSSKYLERLLDALMLLQVKIPDVEAKVPGTSLATPELKSRISSGLLAARKGQLEFGDDGATLTGDALQRELEAFAVDEVREMFGVVTLQELGRLILSLASSVNAQLRAGSVGESMYVRPGEDVAYFSGITANPDPSDRR
ncbi:hypothetical protein ACFPT7_16720 [Acidicapsa dinghuensis]|uniref:Uncharacterized protein n=1 Tax=Acidicapsa dinghuensis TaxID=2218256 RepID=A0ABW1EL17_9BACT|nr:hypothetical protein [Acidicapsa dinghuensis]